MAVRDVRENAAATPTVTEAEAKTPAASASPDPQAPSAPSASPTSAAAATPSTQRRLTTCVFCDGGCRVAGVIEDGELLRLEDVDPAAPVLCHKAANWRRIVEHPDRLTQPLKNRGTRDEPRFEPISWETALDEIAERLGGIIAKGGPEALAVSDAPVNHQTGTGVVRRLLNVLGSPNYLTPMELCMGNTAQIHRLTYGWFSSSAYEVADCIVYFGQTRSPDNWPQEYLRLQAALRRGAKLIVVEPRRNELTERADYHLPLRYGTDAALLLGWLNVIIEEGLYDREVVARDCTGFERLAERVRDYPVEKVARICGLKPALIREAARLYATGTGSIIPWGVSTDMQLNSTSALRCQCILRAICGFLGTSELLGGLGREVVSISQLEAHEALGASREALQLGYDNYPLLSYRGMAAYKRVSRASFGTEYVNIANGSCMAHPPTVFEAMRTGRPYPVKAFFSLANNTLLSYANQQGIREALANLDLLVVYDLFLTPTAQMADYVLPGDTWLERESLAPVIDIAPVVRANSRLRKAPEGCRDLYHVMAELARRLGLGEHFPWKDNRELIDHRLRGCGIGFDELAAGAPRRLTMGPATGRPAEGTADGASDCAEIRHSVLDTESNGGCMRDGGCSTQIMRTQKPHQGFSHSLMEPATRAAFATPSGRIELYSSILEHLGYDPLPYYREPAPDTDRDAYPLTVFIGLREASSYNTALRQVPALRARQPEPLLLMNPADVEEYGLSEGAWTVVETERGSVELLCHADDAQPKGSVRVPHGWWKPETGIGLVNGYSRAMSLNDGLIAGDDADNLDPEQGLPNLRGGIYARVRPACRS